MTPSTAPAASTASAPPPGAHRPRRVDLVVTAAATVALAVLIALTLWGQQQNAENTLGLWLDVAAGVLACAMTPILLLRRSLPAAGVMAALAAVSAGGTPGATLAVYQAACAHPPRKSAAIAAIGVIAHLLRWLWQPLPGLGFTWWLLLVVAVHAALWAIGALQRSRAEVIGSLRERARRAEADAERQAAQARAAERARIAREMHDVLAHRLSLLATYAGALEYRPDAAPERIAEAATILREGTHRALEDLRDVIGLLRHDLPDGDPGSDPNSGSNGDPNRDAAHRPSDDRDSRRPPPVLADLPGLVDEVRGTGAGVELTGAPMGDQAPELTQRTAYRVAQEGLTNARRHAPGATIRVSVGGSAGNGLTIEVINGAAPAGGVAEPDDAGAGRGAGAGLVGLTERVTLAGGSLVHGPTGDGYVLRAHLPWPE